MKLKYAFLSTTLSLFLFGCGGGSNNSSNSTSLPPTTDGVHNTSFNQFTTFNWLLDQNSTFVEISDMSINANILYEDLIQLDSKSPKLSQLGYSVISKDGLYTPDQTKYVLGYRRFNIQSVAKNGNSIKKTPYNINRLKGYSIEEKGHWIDLTNTIITDSTAVYWKILADKIPNSVFFEVQPFQYQFKKFLSNANLVKFPKGAKCFKIEETLHSLPYFIINNHEDSIYSGNQEIKTLKDYIAYLGSDASTGRWGNIEWVYSKKLSNDPKHTTLTVYANINNKLASGWWIKNPNQKLKNEIESLQQQLSYPDTYFSEEDKISYEASVQEKLKQCDYYNPIAANTIKELIKKSEI